MEYREALGILRNRLDDSLTQHAAETDKSDIGEIYKLQEYSETHYYMKAVHDYTAAEVEALLSFVDPLEVAFWCREENTHEVGLPICDILKEINVDSRFPKMTPELSPEDKVHTLVKEKRTDVMENRSERNRWIENFRRFSDLEELDRKAVIQLVQVITVLGKDELQIQFNYQDEYEKALALITPVQERMVV